MLTDVGTFGATGLILKRITPQWLLRGCVNADLEETTLLIGGDSFNSQNPKGVLCGRLASMCPRVLTLSEQLLSDLK